MAAHGLIFSSLHGYILYFGLLVFFSEGSVVSSFNVSYLAIDGLQIVALQEEIAGGSLGDTPADLLSIVTKNGMYGLNMQFHYSKLRTSILIQTLMII